MRNIPYILIIVLIISSFLAGCQQELPPNKGQEVRPGFSSQDKRHQDVLVQEEINNRYLVVIKSAVGGIGPHDVQLELIDKDGQDSIFSTLITYKDRKVVSFLNKSEVLINGQYLFDINKRKIIDLFSKSYIFDYAINPDSTSMALLLNDGKIGLYLYDFRDKSLKKLHSLDFGLENLEDFQLTLDWLDENHVVFDDPIKGKPSISKIEINNCKVETLVTNAMNPRTFQSTFSFVRTSCYQLSRSKIPIQTIISNKGGTIIANGWLKRVNIEDKYLLAYSTHTNPDINPYYGVNYLVGKTSLQKLSLKGNVFFPSLDRNGGITYYYYHNGKLFPDLIKIK